MKKIFIHYNNGHFELIEKINFTLLHMIDIGVIKIIIDVNDESAYIRGDDGIAKKVKIPSVKGIN